MRRAHSPPASSGWEWNAQGQSTPPLPPRRPPRPQRGTAGTVLAAAALLGLVGLAGAVFVGATGDDGEEPVAAAEPSSAQNPQGASASESPQEPAALQADATPPEPGPVAPRSLDEITWTTEAPATLRDLAREWSIQRDVLDQLNPEISMRQSLPAGAQVVVYSRANGASASVGPPNAGRLLRGVPIPEGGAWAQPEDRSRAFATSETIAAITAALDAYGRRFPGADPVQLGDLSARRGRRISGHQSHQSGRDVDVHLVDNGDGDGFDAERNWFLVKTVIDGGDVRAIFLNRREQTWLRAAARADVGPAAADEYFALIRHEPGHTLHMHIRFACAKQHKLCVAYSMPDADEKDPSKRSKLPSRPGSKPGRSALKLPKRRPKG